MTRLSDCEGTVMNKYVLGMGVSAIFFASGSAVAQTSVTLYGVVDEAIRYQTGSASSTGHTTGMSEGAINGTRLGFKGAEDLGGGLGAIFDLQSGFNIANGTADQQGQEFGRYAFVGIKSQQYGTLTLGRQYGGIWRFYALNFDPIGGGNINATDWSLFLVGVRFDATVQYEVPVGPVTLTFQHSFGGEAGSAAHGSTSSGAVVYTFSGVTTGIAGAQSDDAEGKQLTTGSVGFNYNYGPVRFYLYGIDAHRDAGFVVARSNSGGALANTNIVSNATTARGVQTSSRTDLFAKIGAMYRITPRVI